MPDLLPRLQERLSQTKQQQLWRQLKPRDPGKNLIVHDNGKKLINFCSNDYLGLSKHPKVIESFKRSADQYGVGSGSAQTICGHTSAHAELEEAIATFLNAPAARIFSTGYMANLGMITTLVKRHDSVFSDRLNHASLIDAVSHAQPTNQRYRHLDYHHLEQLLGEPHHPQQRRWIITDTIFSMQGSHTNLNRLLQLSQQYQAHIIIDDAHGFGVVGPEGRGSCAAAGLEINDFTATNVTFGKALGTFGACVVGSQTLIDAITQYARPFLFTTAMPPAIASATLTSLQCLQQEPQHRQKLLSNTNYFINCASQLELPLNPSTSPIQMLEVGQTEDALAYSMKLAEKGFFIQAIRPPTVAKNHASLRITLNAMHETAQIDALLEACHEIFNN